MTNVFYGIRDDGSKTQPYTIFTELEDYIRATLLEGETIEVHYIDGSGVDNLDCIFSDCGNIISVEEC